jgi:hypothetical protein
MTISHNTWSLGQRFNTFTDSAVRRMVEWLNLRRLKAYPTIVAVITWVSWLISLWRGSGILDAFSQVVGGDFMAFYTGGRFFLDGRLAQIYDLTAQRSFQESMGVQVQIKGFHPFINPPFATLMYAPFATSDYLPGLVMWWLVGAICYVLAIAILHHNLVTNRTGVTGSVPLNIRAVGRWSFYGLFFYPTMTWIAYGQISGLLLLLFVSTFVLLRRRQDFAAGFIWGILLFKPQLALVVAVVLVVKWRWRALLGGGLTVFGWLATGFVIGWQPILEYLHLSSALMELLRAEGYKSWGLHSLYGFSILLLNAISPLATTAITYLLMATGLGIMTWIWYRTPWLPGSRRWDMTMAATFAVSLLISPHLFTYDLMLLLLPFAIVWVYYTDKLPQVILDGGPILVTTAFVYIATFAGSYLSLFQLTIAGWVGIPKIAIQLSVPILILWIYAILRQATIPTQASTQ